MKPIIQKIAKNSIAIFFSIVFIGGFFSKSLMTYTMPNVTVKDVQTSTQIEAMSEEGGLIAAKKTKQFVLSKDAIVQEVYIKKGSYIAKGAKLFKVSTTDGLSPTDQKKAIDEKIALERQKIAQIDTASRQSYEQSLKELTLALQPLKAKLIEQTSLQKEGAIAQSEVNETKIQIQALEEKRKQLNANFDFQKTQDSLSRQTMLQSIQDLERQKKLLSPEDGGDFASINQNGEVFSDVEGYATDIPMAGRHYTQGESITTIGICSSYEDLCFEMRMGLRSYYQAKEANASMFLTSKDGTKIGRISLNYKKASFADGDVIIRGEFNEEPDVWIFPGLEVVSRSSYSFFIEGETQAIPRSAVINNAADIEGNTTVIYVVREEEDALGKSSVAVKMPVQVLSLTNEFAIIKTLEFMPSNKVITNPSARIKDGTKVYVCP